MPFSLCPRHATTATDTAIAVAIAFAFAGALPILSSCAVVETGASVVKATASVASATVGVASTVVGTTVGTAVTVGSATVSAASAAKSVTVAAAGTAVAAGGVALAAGSLVVTGVHAMNGAQRADDVASVPVVATAPDRFTGNDGRKWITRNCAEIPAGQPALWVAMRSGETVIRSPSGASCPVLFLD